LPVAGAAAEAAAGAAAEADPAAIKGDNKLLAEAALGEAERK